MDTTFVIEHEISCRAMVMLSGVQLTDQARLNLL